MLAQIQQLRNTVGELQQCVRVEQWQASCDRQQAAALREKLKTLSRDLKKSATLTRIATEQLDQMKIQRQADFESMNATVQEIVVSAAEAAEKVAAVEAEGRFATKIKALSSRLRAEERARKYAEGAAEQARNAAAADSARLLANVQSLLDDTKHAAEEENKRTLQKRTVEVQHLTEQVGLLTSAPRSLAAAAEKLGVAAEQQLRPGTGEGASSLNDITGKRTRDAIIRTTTNSIIKTLELASPAGKAEDAAPWVFAHPQMKRLIALAAKPASICSGLLDNLAAAVRIAAAQKKKPLIRQLLSLYPQSMGAQTIAAACSSPVKPIVAGDLVVVVDRLRFHGKKRQYARVASVNHGIATVTLLERTGLERKQRYATAAQATAAVEATAVGGAEANLPLDSLRHASDVVISVYQVYEAWKHGKLVYPGAPLQHEGGLTRQSKSLASVDELVMHLDNEEIFANAEASRRNAERGIQKLRKMSIRRSYGLLKKACARVGVPAIRWNEYLVEVSSKAYAKLTVLNCVCTYCRILIYENKATFLECIDLVLLPKWLHDNLVMRVEAHAMYVAVTYPEKIASVHGREHCDASLCANFALSTANFEPWTSPCSHPNADGSIGQKPEDMNDICNRLLGRNATDVDWDCICGNGCSKDKGKFTMCSDCALVSCLSCIERSANDIGESWRCPECQRAVSSMRHSHSDTLLEDDERIVEEVMNAARVVGLKPGVVAELPDEESHPGGGDAAAIENAYGSMYVADLRALLHERGLSGSGVKSLLVSRLQQDDEDQVGEGEAMAVQGGDGGGDDDADEVERRALRGLEMRLKGVSRNYREAMAHKLRTIQFRRRKYQIIRDLNATTAIEMKDYSGKLEARKSLQGTSENLGKKISNHGSIFVMRNPGENIRERYPDVDWTQYPAASKEAFLQVNCFVACDDSSQSAYTMGCMMEVSYPELKQSFPWLDTVIPFSDQCGDYHSTAATIYNHEIGRLTGIHVGRSEHSEVGEGKGEVDMKFGILAQQFYTTLANSDRADASDLFNQLEEVRRAGDFNMQAAIDRSIFKAGSGKAIPYHDQCQCVEHNREGGGIILREFEGIGSGIPYSKEQLKAHDAYSLMKSEVGSGTEVLRSTKGGMVPVVRDTCKDKAQKLEVKTRKQQEAAERKRRKAENDSAAMAAAVKEHRPKNAVDAEQLRCAACGRTYLSGDRFEEHKRVVDGAMSMCQKQQEIAATKAKQIKNTRLAAQQIMKEKRAKLDEEEKEEQRLLSVVVYDVKCREDAQALKLEVDESGGVVVSSVDPLRVELALRVLKGYRLESCGSSVGEAGDEAMLQQAEAALGVATAASPVRLTFAKPPPTMLAHGWARKKLRVATNNKVMPGQKKWLEEYCDAYEKKGSQPRHMVVYRAMVNRGGLLYVEDGVPFVMSGQAIFNWLKRRWATQKAAGINLATAVAASPAITLEREEGDEEEEEEEDDDQEEENKGARAAKRPRHEQEEEHEQEVEAHKKPKTTQKRPTGLVYTGRGLSKCQIDLAKLTGRWRGCTY